MGVTVGEPLDPLERSMLFSLPAEVAFIPTSSTRPMTVEMDEPTPTAATSPSQAAYEGTLSFDRVIEGSPAASCRSPRGRLSADLPRLRRRLRADARRAASSTRSGAPPTSASAAVPRHARRQQLRGAVDSAEDVHRLEGGFTLADMFFGGGADIVKGEVTLRAEWRALNEQYLNFRTAIAELGFAPPDIPEGLDLALELARASYDVQQSIAVFEAHSVNYGDALFVALRSAPEWRYLFGVKVDKKLDLANLPLIDHLLPSGTTLAVDEIQALLYTAIDEVAQRAISEHVTGPYQPRGAARRQRRRAAEPRRSTSPARECRSRSRSAAEEEGAAESARLLDPAAGDQPSDGTVWFDVQQSFGPVTFEKVGIRYADSVLWFLMNASVGAAGLTISVFGLGWARRWTTSTRSSPDQRARRHLPARPGRAGAAR